MLRATINPALLAWAIERSGRTREELVGKFPRLTEWESGDLAPTYKQLESFAKATYAPVGALFLEQPPVEKIPIPDFRTFRDETPPARASADLLDTLHHCQERQDWYRDLALSERREPLAFVGSLDTSTQTVHAAAEMREVLGFGVEERRAMGNWEEALRSLFRQAENVGILAMRNGIVESNTRRALDPEEFRGFALVDDLAPLVFVNANDTKAAQMFTLVHELAHVWIGASGLSNARLSGASRRTTEAWCNATAAELLVPMEHLSQQLRSTADPLQEARRLARVYKVSSLVLLRRLRDLGSMDEITYWKSFRQELKRLEALGRPSSGGGNYFANQTSRLGQQFTRTLVLSALEGQTLYRDAFRLLGVRKMETFQKLAAHVGVPV